jgi:hypothetical protein
MKMLMPNGSEIFGVNIFTLMMNKISLPHQQEGQNHQRYDDISGFTYQAMDLIFSISYKQRLCNNNAYPYGQYKSMEVYHRSGCRIKHRGQPEIGFIKSEKYKNYQNHKEIAKVPISFFHVLFFEQLLFPNF